jgi:hypothetical protein
LYGAEMAGDDCMTRSLHCGSKRWMRWSSRSARSSGFPYMTVTHTSGSMDIMRRACAIPFASISCERRSTDRV